MISKNPKIMIIDDTPENLKLLEVLLNDNNCKVFAFPRGKMAIKAAKINPPDLVLLDINMPEMNGYTVCKIFKNTEKLKDIPIIFISALNEIDDKILGFEMGGADYITKPFDFAEVKARIKTHLQIKNLQLELKEANFKLEEKVRAQVKEIADSQMATIFALAKLSESRDNDTGKHIERVQYYCYLLAKEMSKMEKYKTIISNEFIDNIFHASPLHDIGKVGIIDGILLKPGKLTIEEFEIMKSHTIIGAKTLEKAKSKYPKNNFLSMGIDLAKSHHEKWNGSGYPDGLKFEQIPLAARILAIADAYDTLRNKRVYKPSVPHKRTCDLIISDSGTHFDPDAIKAFKNLKDVFNKHHIHSLHEEKHFYTTETNIKT